MRLTFLDCFLCHRLSWCRRRDSAVLLLYDPEITSAVDATMSTHLRPCDALLVGRMTVIHCSAANWSYFAQIEVRSALGSTGLSGEMKAEQHQFVSSSFPKVPAASRLMTLDPPGRVQILFCWADELHGLRFTTSCESLWLDTSVFYFTTYN